jgi:hypothetical protein
MGLEFSVFISWLDLEDTDGEPSHRDNGILGNLSVGWNADLEVLYQ